MLPRDLMQVLGAQELYRREWRYHSELRIWVKARTPQELAQSHANVQFCYFDVNSWEPRLFTSNYRNLVNGLLSEDDLKFKMNSNPPPTLSSQQLTSLSGPTNAVTASLTPQQLSSTSS